MQTFVRLEGDKGDVKAVQGEDSGEQAVILPPGPVSFEIEQQIDEPKATWMHASFHTVCAVVGAGVLGLPHAFSYLGWAGGIFTLTLFTVSSIYTSYILAALHDNGNRRLNTYREIGEAVLGPRAGKWAVLPVQYSLMVGLCITYAVTAGQSFKGIASSDCTGADCQNGIAPWIVLFGGTQLLLSQVPDFHSLWWISLLGALMSIGYCLIAVIMSIIQAADGSEVVFSRGEESQADRIFGVFNALGGIAFTYGGQAVLPEIQATLAKPPPPVKSMMKALYVAYVVVISTYYSVAISGYAAFGSAVSDDVLLNITTAPGVVKAANMMVVLHVAAGYQVFAMPIFDAVERTVRQRMKNPPRPLYLRLVFRSLYVVGTTFVACLLPFFGELMGLISSIGLMPVTFILPPLMWIKARKPSGFELAANVFILTFSIGVAALSLVGSMRNIIVSASEYGVF